MSVEQTITATPATQVDPFRFLATDVTGVHEIEVDDLQPNLPAGAVAQALASRMSLPADVPWTIRDQATSVYLDDEVAIGKQVNSDATLTITPKTHLG